MLVILQGRSRSKGSRYFCWCFQTSIMLGNNDNDNNGKEVVMYQINIADKEAGFIAFLIDYNLLYVTVLSRYQAR